MSREADDLTNSRFLNLLVIRRTDNTPSKHTAYECLLDCGHMRILARENIINLPARYFFICKECPFPESKTRREKRELHERALARFAAHRCPDCGLDEWSHKSARGRLGRCPACSKKNSQGESRGIGERIHIFKVAWERVNRMCVLRRDKVCQHCGTEAEPQLDHILPMKLGGAHSYANVQRLCKKCNRYKHSHIEREPKLVGVVDLTPYKVAKNPPGTPYTTIPEAIRDFRKRREAERKSLQ